MCVITNPFHIQSRYGFEYIAIRSWHKTDSIILVPLMKSIFNNGMVFNIIPGTEINIVLLCYKIISRAFSVSAVTFPFHQGKVVFPGFIQDQSLILLGGADPVIILVSRNLPGRLLINITLQGLSCGRPAITA